MTKKRTASNEAKMLVDKMLMKNNRNLVDINILDRQEELKQHNQILLCENQKLRDGIKEDKDKHKQYLKQM